MAGSRLAEVQDSDHLMRFVPAAHQVRDPDTFEFKGIVNTAFSIRPSDDGGLSLTWVEHYGAKSMATYGIAASAFRDSLISRKLPAKAYFAIGEAGKTREVAKDHGKKVRLVHAPDGSNTGHVELHRFTDEDRRLLDALALEVFTEHVAVKELDLR
jgi:hypothetical protein